MRMIPESTRFVVDLNLIQEPIGRRDGALTNARYAVRPGYSILEDAVPMLQ
jgi:hypothetical protein